MDSKLIVGNAATIFTIGVFLSGIEICKRIQRNGTTINISALPFICGLVSCSLWMRYGLLIKDSALTVVNLVGGSLQIMYMIWYLKFTLYKVTFYKQLSVALSVIGLVYGYTTFVASDEDARFVSGIASCSAGVIFMASPLAAVAHVMKTKSSENLPFYMIVCTLVMAFLWFVYGRITNDLFVQIPNFLGVLLALSQLCLFFLYPKKVIYDLPLVT